MNFISLRRGTFTVFGLACFAASWWARTRVPETAGVSLEDIDRLFASEAGREDAELRREVSRTLLTFGFPPPHPIRHLPIVFYLFYLEFSVIINERGTPTPVLHFPFI